MKLTVPVGSLERIKYAEGLRRRGDHGSAQLEATLAVAQAIRELTDALKSPSC